LLAKIVKFLELGYTLFGNEFKIEEGALDLEKFVTDEDRKSG
jgi:hypothetical protein